MNAATAREQSTKAQQKNTNKQLKVCRDRIRHAAANGDTETMCGFYNDVMFGGCLSKENAEILRADGYKVKDVCTFGTFNNYTNVSWRDPT